MILSFIVAVSDNNAIGRHNTLPWHLPEDLKFFKRTTMGKPVVMGRKTFESLGRALPGRTNIVISTHKELLLPQGVVLCDNIDAAIERLQKEDAEEGFIIGGGQIFANTMNIVDRMYITRVHTIVHDADAFFPDIDHTHWKMVAEERHHVDDNHQYPFAFERYERVEL
jgi:dihydrofolate reductase